MVYSNPDLAMEVTLIYNPRLREVSNDEFEELVHEFEEELEAA